MATTIQMSDYTFGTDCYGRIAQACAEHRAERVALIGGERALAAAEPRIREALAGSPVRVLGSFVYGKECTQGNVDALLAKPEVRDADLIFAVGGGKAIDTAKVVADLAGKETFSFPTICSNCSAATAIAVVYNDDGSLARYHYPAAPAHIFIDPQVIAEAPAEYFWAGIGDALSKEPEVLFASQGKELDHTATLGVTLARACSAPLFEYGEAGLASVRAGEASRAVGEVALDIVISTGYVSNLTNQPDFYYNSTLAHAFYNGSCSVAREGEYLHGQLVSFGVLVLFAYAGDEGELARYAAFNKRLGLPVTLAEIGLTDADLPAIAEAATKTNEWKNAPYPFTTEKFVEAIRAADAHGRAMA